MVSKASEDLPDPESPVMTVRAFRGISTVMFLRLCSRAPRTTNDSLDIDSEPTRVLASRSTLPNLLLKPSPFPTLALPHGSGRAGRADHPRHRGGRSPAGDGPGGGTARGLRHARAGRGVDLPLGGRADGGGRGARGTEDRCVEVGRARRGRARAAPLRRAGAVGIAGRARAGPLPCVAHERGGRVIRKREPRWQSAADRARVAAELLEEAESLSENSTIATPAEVARASLPPPIRAQLPDAAPPTAPEGGAGGAGGAVGGRRGGGGGGAAGGGRVALRKQPDRAASGGGARQPAPPDPRPAAGCRAAPRAGGGGGGGGGGARGHGRPGDGGARPRR